MDLCPLKPEIVRFSIGFRLNSFCFNICTFAKSIYSPSITISMIIKSFFLIVVNQPTEIFRGSRLYVFTIDRFLILKFYLGY